MTNDNVLVDKSIAFAIRIVNCYNFLVENKKEFTMSKQVFRSGTSIGANIHEAIQGQSRADFVSKMGIALKEASETSYWLVLLHRTSHIDDQTYHSMRNDIDEIIRILIATIKNTKKNGL
ncbi:MAG: four helix bundle protein [Prevotella sp.]|nr:four helix bundle protein [Prevotella sp.]